MVGRIECTALTFLRKLPEGFEHKVKTGETVSGGDIVSEGSQTKGFRVLPLAKETGLPPSRLLKFLVKKEGDNLYRKEVLVKSPGFLGFGKKLYLSPTSGKITRIDKQNGNVTLEYPRQSLSILSGFWGEVTETSDSGISIHTRAITINGAVYAGGRKEGFLKILTPRHEFLLPQVISREHEGFIVLGGIIPSNDVLAKIAALKISAVITGSCNYRHFKPLFSTRQISLFLTEGFGNAAIGENIWEIIRRFDNRYIFLEENPARLVIPLKPNEKCPDSKNQNLVRIVYGDHFSKIGEVLKKSNKKEQMESGLSAIMLDIKTPEGENIKVPENNVEKNT